MDRRIERTRRTVVRSTVELVGREGSHVGMTEIAQAAGVSRKAVYENFGTREQVLLSAAESLLRAHAATRAAGAAKPWSLEGALHEVVNHVDAHRAFYAAVLAGPAGTVVREALVAHVVSATQASSMTQHGASEALQDRFAAHGLLAVMSDALQANPKVHLMDLVSALPPMHNSSAAPETGH